MPPGSAPNLPLLFGVWLPSVIVIAALVTVLVVRDNRKRRAELEKTLLSHIHRLGWLRVDDLDRSMVPWARFGGERRGCAMGQWQGRPAELVLFYLYKFNKATLVAITAPPSPKDFKQFVAIDALYGYTYGVPLGPPELRERFRFTGEPSELAAVFTREVAGAIVGFARRTYQIMFDGNTVSVAWYGWESDSAAIDAAFDIAQKICRSLEAAAAQA